MQIEVTGDTIRIVECKKDGKGGEDTFEINITFHRFRTWGWLWNGVMTRLKDILDWLYI